LLASGRADPLVALTLVWPLTPANFAQAPNLLGTIDSVIDLGSGIFIAVQLLIKEAGRRFDHFLPRGGFGRNRLKDHSRPSGAQDFRQNSDETVKRGLIGLRVFLLVPSRWLKQTGIFDEFPRQVNRAPCQQDTNMHHLRYSTPATSSDGYDLIIDFKGHPDRPAVHTEDGVA